ncbi:MAG: YebC/PmpR family DNA-binding transcriptional regulator [Gammaproteobacteria bacterium]|nr:YebC/PmpR family DNA-binding transcriptional regulator [Gammaproteobacteria bacterium]
MAGHSKWANIQHRKGRQDAKRGKIFTKIIREIVTAARLGGGDPTCNPRLRDAIDKGLSNNMTRDTIERAAKRGAGGEEGGNMESMTYEGYGPGGVAVLVECLSDNRNRTVAEVRHAFTKCGGNLGTDGSVSYLFAKKGQIVFGEGADEDKIMEVALESGAEDVVSEEGAVEVLTAPEDYLNVKAALDKAGLKYEQAEITMIPSTWAELAEEDLAAKMIKMQDMLEDLDDVQNVWSNADIPVELMEKLG